MACGPSPVLAVITYHNFGWLPGGFYGVDAFFVLSGFLITTLLVTEWHASGTVRLGAFWARRARRLLPALFVLVAVIGLIAAVWPSAFGPVDLLPGALATVFYSANWFFIGGHSSYFAAAGPQSPLLHTWSLAIEEQFYLVWPLVVLAVLHVGWRRGRRGAAGNVKEAGPSAHASPATTRGATGPPVVASLAGEDGTVPVAGSPDQVLCFGGPTEVDVAVGGPRAAMSAARRLEWLFALSVVGVAASAIFAHGPAEPGRRPHHTGVRRHPHPGPGPPHRRRPGRRLRPLGPGPGPVGPPGPGRGGLRRGAGHGPGLGPDHLHIALGLQRGVLRGVTGCGGGGRRHRPGPPGPGGRGLVLGTDPGPRADLLRGVPVVLARSCRS